MRTVRFRALAVSLLLTFMLSSVPVMAGPREGDRDGRDFSFIGRLLSKIKRTLGASTNADGLTLPTP